MNDDLFRDTSAQRHADKVIKFINCHVVIIVLRSGQGVTCRHTAGNDGDFMNIIGMLAELCKDRVAGFVICRTLLVCFGHDAALFLRTHDDLIDPLIELQISDHILPCPCRQNGCLIEKICKVCSGESARHAGDHLEIHVGSKRLIAGMDLQDRLTPLDVGQIDVDLTVEPPGTKESGVKNIRTVGRRHDDDPLIRLKAVHLNKDLIEGLFPFIVSAPKTGSSLTAYGVDFIDEDNAGLVAFRHVKQVTHTRSTDADVHFHEVGTADREEGNPRLPCNGLRKQRFTRSGRPYKQNALRDLCPKIGKLLRAFEELDNLFQFLFLFLRSRNIRKTHFQICGDSCLRLAEVHDLSATAAHRAKDQEKRHDADNKNGYIEKIPPSGPCIGVVKFHLDPVLQPLRQIRRVGIKLARANRAVCVASAL